MVIGPVLSRPTATPPGALKTLPLWWEHDIKQPVPDWLQAGAHLVGLIRGNLGKRVVDPVHETLGARFVDFELRDATAILVLDYPPHRSGPAGRAMTGGKVWHASATD